MEMQQVRYFLAVARLLNFTRAAEECNVTQPALTRAIKQLEDELGGDLIRREGRHSHLTDLGQRMLPLLQQCHDSALTAKRLADKVTKGEVGGLALAVSRSLDLDQVLGFLAEIERCFPGLRLKLRRGTGAEIAEMLKTGEVDLAIAGPIGERWDRLETWPIFTESFDLVVGVDHPLAMSNALLPDCNPLRGLRFLVHANPDPAEFEPERLASAGLCAENAHEVDTDHDLEALVKAAFGAAILPASTMKDPRARHFAVPALDWNRTIAIYSVAGRHRTREAAALLMLVRSAGRDSARVLP